MSTLIENIETKISALTTASVTGSKRMVDDSVFVISRNLRQSISLSALIPRAQRAKARELREMLGNESFGIISFSSVVHERLNYLYAVDSGGVSQSGGENYAFSFSADGPYKSYNWVIEPDESITYWDTMDYEADGVYTNLQNICTSGSVTDGGYYIQIAAGANFNAGYMWWSNYSVEGHVWSNGDSAGDQIELLIRKQITCLSDKWFYRMVLDFPDNEIRFEYVNGTPTTTILKTWTAYPDGTSWGDLTSSAWYVMKVVARGNRFDLFFGTSDQDGTGTGAYVGTVYDEQLQAGTYGFAATSVIASITVIDVQAEKPVIACLPFGAYDCNRIRMPDTSRSDDDISSYGLQKNIIAPDNPVNFKQELDDPTGVGVKVWDTMDKVESEWEQVYDIDHYFVGNMVITNGLIKLLYGVSETQITLSVYSNGAWEDIVLMPMWSPDTIDSIKAEITELKKHVVTLKEATYYEQFGEIDMVWTEYTIRTGSPMVHIENRRAL